MLSQWLYEKVQLNKVESLFTGQNSVKLECGLVLLQPIQASVLHAFLFVCL